jgi:TRAP-type transport system periplasmic protein
MRLLRESTENHWTRARRARVETWLTLLVASDISSPGFPSFEAKVAGDSMKRSRFLSAVALGLCTAAFSLPASAQVITLHGASQFSEDHPFTKGLMKFEELVKKYYGKPINFVLHKNSELGLEKDYFAYMNQGISVDYAIVSPAHMATFAKAAPFIDAPFVFRDHEQMNKVIKQGVLKPISDEIAQKADVLLLGYGGGGVRNIFANKPIHNMAELKGLKIRVQGAPIWTRTFAAAGMAPTVIAYSEIYNGIQTGVIQAGDNEAAGVEQMKFYEVGPNLMLTRHAISIRPICFSGKTLRKLPPDLQAAIRKAAAEAGDWERELESSSDTAILTALEKAGKLKQVKFEERDKLQAAMAPALAAYAKEIGADAIYAKINAIK